MCRHKVKGVTDLIVTSCQQGSHNLLQLMLEVECLVGGTPITFLGGNLVLIDIALVNFLVINFYFHNNIYIDCLTIKLKSMDGINIQDVLQKQYLKLIPV